MKCTPSNRCYRVRDIERLYSVCKVSATDPNSATGIGAVLGGYGTGIVRDVVYDNTIQPDLPGIAGANQGACKVIGKSPNEMKRQESYPGWDFNEVWNISPAQHDGLPLLLWQLDPVWNAVTQPTSPSATNSVRVVSEGNSYYISVATPLTLVAVYGIDGNTLPLVANGDNNYRITTSAQHHILIIVYRDGDEYYTTKWMV